MLTKTVVMVGMMGSGKTAIGKSLAHNCGVAFCDSDSEIIKAADMPIADIFEKYGEDFFRSMETNVIKRLITDDVSVLSIGGGAFISPQNREMLSQHAVSVQLSADVDLLWERVRHKTTRPLLQTQNPYQTLADLYASRKGVYDMADITVQVLPEHSIQQTTERLMDHLTQAGVIQA